MKRKLYIDIETYSSVSLADCGVYRYAASPDFRVLLLAYAWDDEPVQVVDLESGDRIPGDVEEAICHGVIGSYDALTDVDVHAHNATFERVCLSHHFAEEFGPDDFISPDHWSCTMVKAGARTSSASSASRRRRRRAHCCPRPSGSSRRTGPTTGRSSRST